MFFGEKALLALKGTPPRLENIGFIYPPLPVFTAGLFNGNALLAQSFIASLISASIAIELIRGMQSFRAAFPFIIYMVFSLPILFLSTQRFDLYLYFFLIILSMKFLYQNNYSGIPCIYHAIPDIYGDIFIYQLGFYERSIWIFKGIQTDVF